MLSYVDEYIVLTNADGATDIAARYDMRAQDLSATGMEGGVCNSRCCPHPPGAVKRP